MWNVNELKVVFDWNVIVTYFIEVNDRSTLPLDVVEPDRICFALLLQGFNLFLRHPPLLAGDTEGNVVVRVESLQPADGTVRIEGLSDVGNSSFETKRWHIPQHSVGQQSLFDLPTAYNNPFSSSSLLLESLVVLEAPVFERAQDLFETKNVAK